MKNDELQDLNQAMGTLFDELTEARSSLTDCVDAGKLDDQDIIGLLWRRVSREVAVASGVMGALAHREFPTLN